MRNVATVIGLASLAAAGSLLSGCGGGETTESAASESPSRILRDAKHVVSSANSVHIAGRGVSQGKPARLDLSLVRGPKATGEMEVFGGSLDLIRVRDSVYMRGDRSFWRAFGRNRLKLALLTGRWVQAPASLPAFREIASFTDISDLSSVLSAHGKVVNKGVRTFRGQKVVALHDATDGGTLYLRATGSRYPVAIVGGKKDGEVIIFDRWNQRVVVRAPKNALLLGASA